MNPALLQQFNQFSGERKTLIRKALDSSVGAGASPNSPLIAQHLERIITNDLVRLAPELAVIEPEYGPQKYHEFNRLTKLPRAGGAMGEAAITPTGNGEYIRDTVELKIIRRKGAVTNFLQDASKNYIDAAATEMENHVQSHGYDLISYLEYGNKGANKYTFDGLDTLIKTHRWNNAQGGRVPADLSFLDRMIDANMAKQGANHKKAFLMSPHMQSHVSRLLTNVRLQQGGPGATVEIKGGWRLESYRSIPILPVAALMPKPKMTGVTGTGSGSFARVSSVSWDGESEASDGVSCSSGLTWTPVNDALFYKIYAGATEGECKLVAVIPAATYDGVGTPAADVAGITVTGDITQPNPAITLVAPAGILTGVSNSVTTETAQDIPKVASGGVVPEDIILWDLDKTQGLGKVPYTNSAGDRFQGLVTITPLAVTDDNVPFMIKSYLTLCPSFEATSVMSKGWRTQ
jgi:hypothetical protein